MDSIEKDKLSLTDLGKLLSRHPHSILKRHDVLSNGRVFSRTLKLLEIIALVF